MRPQLQQADGGVTRPARSWEMGLPQGGCSWGKSFYSVLSPEQFWGHVMGPILMASQGQGWGGAAFIPHSPAAVWLHEGSPRCALRYAINHCSEEK